jgi:predicted nicotinamide N-methyase
LSDEASGATAGAMSPSRYATFIRDNLVLLPVPGVPEVRLYTAHRASRLSRIAIDAPYFAYPWAGGIALARYILDRPEQFAGRRVLDLGAGSGLVGIAAALCGASVTAAEVDPAGVAAIGLNAEANGVDIAILAGDPLAAPPSGVDIVLAGDVFYAPPVAARMLAFLELCAASGIEVLVGDPGRADLPVKRLRRIESFMVADFGDSSAVVNACIYAIDDGGDARAALAQGADCGEEDVSSGIGQVH